MPEEPEEKERTHENEIFNFVWDIGRLDHVPVWRMGCRIGDIADLHGG